jgi:hypothetical protein
MDVGGLGPSFAPPIQWTSVLSNVAGALSFDAFAFFATDAGVPTTAPGVGTDRIAFPLSQVQQQLLQAWQGLPGASGGEKCS